MDDEIRIVIADDHPVVRRGLVQVIESDPLLKVVAEKLLIADDLLVERLAASAKRESQLTRQEQRLMVLEQRVTRLESRPPAEHEPPSAISGDAA